MGLEQICVNGLNILQQGKFLVESTVDLLFVLGVILASELLLPTNKTTMTAATCIKLKTILILTWLLIKYYFTLIEKSINVSQINEINNLNI